LYGQLLTRLGENERALLAFRSGLALVSAIAAEPLPSAQEDVASVREADARSQR
jgi:hypothetical protein